MTTTPLPPEPPVGSVVLLREPDAPSRMGVCYRRYGYTPAGEGWRIPLDDHPLTWAALNACGEVTLLVEATAVDAAIARAVLAERDRCARALALPGLRALRAIPDGEIRDGCVLMDGRKVRERLRRAYFEIRDGGQPADASGAVTR